jgi:hypothetical protein
MHHSFGLPIQTQPKTNISSNKQKQKNNTPAKASVPFFFSPNKPPIAQTLWVTSRKVCYYHAVCKTPIVKIFCALMDFRKQVEHFGLVSIRAPA